MRFYTSMPERNILVDKIFKWIVDVLVVVVFAVFFMTYLGGDTIVVGNSMSRQLQTGDKVLIDSLIYNIVEPSKYDVIAFNKTEANGDKVEYIKRIVGVPGDTVQIKEGKIYVNNKVIDKKLKYEKIVNPGIAQKEIKLSYNEYFVIGDNVNSSEDSRFSTVSNVKKNEIIGKVWLITSPFIRINIVN